MTLTDDYPLPAPLTSRTPTPRWQSLSIEPRRRTNRACTFNSRERNSEASVTTGKRKMDSEMSDSESRASSRSAGASASSSSSTKLKRGMKRSRSDSSEDTRPKRRNSGLGGLSTAIDNADEIDELESESNGSVGIGSLWDELDPSLSTPFEGPPMTQPAAQSQATTSQIAFAPILEEPSGLEADEDASFDGERVSQVIQSPPHHSPTRSTFVSSPSLSRILNHFDDDPPASGSSATAQSAEIPVTDIGAPPPSPSKDKGKQKAEAPPDRKGTPEAEPSTLADYTCPICFSAPTNATLTPCGHICCGPCLFSAVKSSLKRAHLAGSRADEGGARCPVCRAEIPGWDGKGGGVIGLKVRALFTL